MLQWCTGLVQTMNSTKLLTVWSQGMMSYSVNVISFMDYKFRTISLLLTSSWLLVVASCLSFSYFSSSRKCPVISHIVRRNWYPSPLSSPMSEGIRSRSVARMSWCGCSSRTGGAVIESRNRNLRSYYLTSDYRGCGGGGLVLWDLGRLCSWRLRGDYGGSGGGGLILWNLGCLSSRGLHRNVSFTGMSWVLGLGLRQFRTLVMLSIEAFYGCCTSVLRGLTSIGLINSLGGSASGTSLDRTPIASGGIAIALGLGMAMAVTGTFMALLLWPLLLTCLVKSSVVWPHHLHSSRLHASGSPAVGMCTVK